MMVPIFLKCVNVVIFHNSQHCVFLFIENDNVLTFVIENIDVKLLRDLTYDLRFLFF